MFLRCAYEPHYSADPWHLEQGFSARKGHRQSVSQTKQGWKEQAYKKPIERPTGQVSAFKAESNQWPDRSWKTRTYNEPT